MMNAGFHAIPIDYGANKFSPKVKTLDVDLGSDAGLSLSTELLQHVRPFIVHFGLPCGTCSRAREIPLAKKLKSMGAPEPPPLRSHSHLLGLPGLTGTDAIRVEAANRIYKNAVSLLQTCFILRVHVMLENPTRSWLWAVLAQLVKNSGDLPFISWYFSLHDIDFDACMHGGNRAKSTRLKVSAAELDSLAIVCDGRHQHKPWTVSMGPSNWQFSTASEAEYPTLLCKRIAQVFAKLAPESSLHYTAKSLRLNTLKAASKQHKRHRQLIPDFAYFEDVTSPPSSEQCKILERPLNRGENQDVENNMEDDDNIDNIDRGENQDVENNMEDDDNIDNIADLLDRGVGGLVKGGRGVCC